MYAEASPLPWSEETWNHIHTAIHDEVRCASIARQQTEDNCPTLARTLAIRTGPLISVGGNSMDLLLGCEPKALFLQQGANGLEFEKNLSNNHKEVLP